MVNQTFKNLIEYLNSNYDTGSELYFKEFNSYEIHQPYLSRLNKLGYFTKKISNTYYLNAKIKLDENGEIIPFKWIEFSPGISLGLYSKK